MYALLARIPEGLEPLRKKFEEHVKKAGLAAVAKLTQAAGEGGAAAEVVRAATCLESFRSPKLRSFAHRNQKLTWMPYSKFMPRTKRPSTGASRAKPASLPVWIGFVLLHPVVSAFGELILVSSRLARTLSTKTLLLVPLRPSLPNCSPNTPMPYFGRTTRLARTMIWRMR